MEEINRIKLDDTNYNSIVANNILLKKYLYSLSEYKRELEIIICPSSPGAEIFFL